MRITFQVLVASCSMLAGFGCGGASDGTDDGSLEQTRDEAALVYSASPSPVGVTPGVIQSPQTQLRSICAVAQSYFTGQLPSLTYVGEVFHHYESYTPGNPAPGAIYGSHSAAIFRTAAAAEARDISQVMIARVCDYRAQIIY